MARPRISLATRRRPVHALVLALLASLAVGGCKSEAQDDTSTDSPPPTSSTVSLSASPAAVEYGADTTLSWSGDGVRDCQASGDWSGPRAPNGSTAVGPLTADSRFVLTCSGSDGTVEDTATVSVADPAAPSVSLAADPTSVVLGDSTDLQWSAADADSCEASGGWSGARSTSGTETVGPLDTDRTFTLSCTGPGGTGSASVRVTVYDPTPAPSISLAASPSTVAAGGTSTLTWDTTDAGSCEASGAWSGTRALSGSAEVGPLDATATFTLSCDGAGGSASESVTVAVSAPSPTVSLSADPALVGPDQTLTLQWSSTDADECIASGAWSGTRATSGTETVGPLSADRTFTLECRGAGGSASDSVTVAFDEPPTVSVSATPELIHPGETTTLTWSSSNAESCEASGAWTGTKAVDGSEEIGSLSESATLTLTCRNVTDTATTIASAEVGVYGEATVAWDPPATYTDGTPITDLAGYNVYTGTSASDLTKIGTVDASQETYTVTDLLPGATHYFAVTAFDGADMESGYSEIVSKTIP